MHRSYQDCEQLNADSEEVENRVDERSGYYHDRSRGDAYEEDQNDLRKGLCVEEYENNRNEELLEVGDNVEINLAEQPEALIFSRNVRRLHELLVPKIAEQLVEPFLYFAVGDIAAKVYSPVGRAYFPEGVEQKEQSHDEGEGIKRALEIDLLELQQDRDHDNEERRLESGVNSVEVYQYQAPKLSPEAIPVAISESI